MNWSLVLNGVLVVAVVVLVGFIAPVLIELWQISRIVKKELSPLISKLNTTIDEVNTELSRVDGIVQSAERVSKTVDSTTKAAQEVISSPLIKLVSISAGIKKALSTFGKK